MQISRPTHWALGSSSACRSKDVQAQVLHATSIEIDGRGVLIRGASGSGKSSLGLQLMALGGVLIADDRTRASLDGGDVFLDAPDTIRGQIEARGVGILNSPTAGPTPAALIVDMDGPVADRLPLWEEGVLLGRALPLVRGNDAAHLPAAILFYVKYGRRA
ncbi:HPr kinase/phosphorylase [Roseovarius arcticus]|uniref:HPr kinase/phosphorylase n=1 Tax=Roseovarius arcticus TaxID=2547404 RepID=UPI00111008FA|nr:HPr kinase/phosphatase C-terminal domain-containing protein [Roseovarius arcticus]